MGYPVIEGFLDSVGGLQLVRLFGALLMVGAMLSVGATARHIWGHHAGLFASFAFATTAPVMFVGDFATFDAPTVFCIAAGMWLGVTRRSSFSALLVGVLLAGAGVFKYTGAVFVPVVLAVMALSGVHRVWRTIVAGATAIVVLVGLWIAAGSNVHAGIQLTTSARAPEDPQSPSWMAHLFASDIGLLALCAAGGVFVAARGLRSALLTLTLVGGGIMLQLAVLRIGEGASFEKHLCFSALFFAPLAGRFLLWLFRRRIGAVCVAGVLAVLAVMGLARSHEMFEGWGDVTPVVNLIEANPVPGAYLSTSASALSYYTRRDPGVDWVNQYAVLPLSDDAQLQKLVSAGTWQMVVLQTGPDGLDDLTSRSAALITILSNSPQYKLVLSAPVLKYSPEDWMVFRLIK